MSGDTRIRFQDYRLLGKVTVLHVFNVFLLFFLFSFVMLRFESTLLDDDTHEFVFPDPGDQFGERSLEDMFPDPGEQFGRQDKFSDPGEQFGGKRSETAKISIGDVKAEKKEKGEKYFSKGECFDQDVDFMGYETGRMLIRDVESIEACQEECVKDGPCRYFTYGTPNTACEGCCFMKSSDKGKKMVPGFISGPKYCDVQKQMDLPCFNEDYDFEGFDLELPIEKMPTPDHCQQLCQAQEECKFFSYGGENSPVKGNCYLKKSDVNARHYKNMISGPKWCKGKGPSSAPTQKPTYGPTSEHERFGYINKETLREQCHTIDKVCFYNEQTYVFDPWYDFLSEENWKYDMSARMGGRIKINVEGQMFNLKKFADEKEFHEMYAKYKTDFTPMIIVQDFPEMFYEMWARVVYHIFLWQDKEWMDKNWPLVILYPTGMNVPNMWKIMLKPFTHYNVYGWDTFFRRLYADGACFRTTTFCRIRQLHRPPPEGMHRQMSQAILEFYKIDIDSREDRKIRVAIVERKKRRRILNRRDLLFRCETELNYECFTLNVESMTTSLFNTLRTIDVFVFMHGSAGVNGLFVPSGSTVLEILPFGAAAFSNKMFRDWVYKGTDINFERFYIKNRYHVGDKEVARWQSSDQYCDWDEFGGALIRSAHRTQISRGMLEAEFIGEKWRGEWTNAALENCEELGKTWGLRKGVFTDVEGTSVPYDRAPPAGFKCADNWTPIVMKIESAENVMSFFYEIVMVLHLLRKNEYINTRFGLILITTTSTLPKMVYQLTRLFVRLDVMTAKDFAKENVVPFKCVKRALFCQSKGMLEIDTVRSVMRDVRTLMTSTAYQWEDPRKSQLAVHFGKSTYLPNVILNQKGLRLDCTRQEPDNMKRECAQNHYDTFDRHTFWRFPWVGVFVFHHSEMGMSSLMFNNGTSVVEIFHEDFSSPHIPDDHFEKLILDGDGTHIFYFKYVETSPLQYVEKSPPNHSGKLKGFSVNMDRFRIVLHEAITKTREYLDARESTGHELNSNPKKVIEGLKDRIKKENPKDYDVKTLYGDPKLSNKKDTL